MHTLIKTDFSTSVNQKTPALLALLFLLALCQNTLYARGLPDTGQILCDDGTNTMVTCSATNTGDTATYPNQDGRYGRDAKSQAGSLPKVGGGHAGFDYTKVCNSGDKAGVNSCPTDPILGVGANNWGCTYDNITELYWEVKTNDGGLRDKGWTYTWYNSNNSTNAGNAGTSNGGSCVDTSNCDTEKYVSQVKVSNLCGFTDWRMPSKRELYTIRNLNTINPAIDTGYFPNTQSSLYWSASSYVANPTVAWVVNFSFGDDGAGDKSGNGRVRLVRGGQSF